MKRQGRASQGGARFVPLGAVAFGGMQGRGGLRLTIGGSYSLEVPEWFDTPTLQRLLEVLERR